MFYLKIVSKKYISYKAKNCLTRNKSNKIIKIQIRNRQVIICGCWACIEYFCKPSRKKFSVLKEFNRKHIFHYDLGIENFDVSIGNVVFAFVYINKKKNFVYIIRIYIRRVRINVFSSFLNVQNYIYLYRGLHAYNSFGTIF